MDEGVEGDRKQLGSTGDIVTRSGDLHLTASEAAEDSGPQKGGYVDPKAVLEDSRGLK